MDKIIGLKALRENVQTYIHGVRRGQTFLVMRRSKPLFRITPLGDEGQWETVADFTHMNKEGISAQTILKVLRKMNV